MYNMEKEQAQAAASGILDKSEKGEITIAEARGLFSNLINDLYISSHERLKELVDKSREKKKNDA